MHKKIILFIFVISSILLISGCNNNEKEKSPINKSNNSVVLYFSVTGTTKKIAQKIAKESNSDIIEIIPKEKYTKDDIDYNKECRANKEQNDNYARPKIKNKIDINKYDTVYLGYPIWWGTNPKIILTLLDSYDFRNKTIIPFCTSGSTEINESVNDLRNYNKELNIKDGKRFSINDSNELIKSFIENNTNEVKKSMKAIINNKEYKVIIEDSDSSQALMNLLPLELEMNELNGNEKYVYLNSKLPTNQYKPKTINKGDLMLYQDNCLVIFYKSFETTYSYTKIGHIDNLEEFGKDNIKIRFEK